MKIEIIPNGLKDKGYVYTKKVCDLLRDYNCEVYLPSICKAYGVPVENISPCNDPDMIIVLGGDGSIIRSAPRSAMTNAPILSINLGHLGYLAELDCEEIELIRSIFTSGYKIEHRSMIEVTHLRDGKPLGKPTVALNDAVLSHGPVSKLIETSLVCNGSSLGHYRADGFLVSTPTGSTAYSLAAGGPILDPSLSGLCLVPICPHSLNARPMIVPDDSIIELTFHSGDGRNAFLTVDGDEAAELIDKDSLVITRSKLKCGLVRINRDAPRNFYGILKKKMSDY